MFDAHVIDDGAGDEDGGVGAEDDADDHRGGESGEDGAAEEGEGDDREQGGEARHHRPCQRLVDGGVDDVARGDGGQFAEVFADAVIDDHGVVHRVAEDGEQCRQHVQVECPAHEREDAGGDDDVVQLRQYRADGEFPLEAQAKPRKKRRKSQSRRVDHRSILTR